MRIALAFLFASVLLGQGVTTPPLQVQQGGTPQGTALVVNCGTNMTCTLVGGVVTFSAASTAATAWSSITAGANANALTMGTGGSLHYSLGIVDANYLLTHALPSLTTGYLNWTGSAWALSAVSGGASIGGAVTSGVANNVLFINPTATLAQDTTFQWYPTATPGPHGQTGLLLGLAQPDFSSCCDGPSNSLGVSLDTPIDLVFDGAGGAASGSTTFSCYASRGTHASPTNLSSGDAICEEDFYGYTSGAQTFLGNYGFFYEGTWTAFSMGATEMGLYDPNNSTHSTGFSSVSATEMEANNGTPVANGGALVQLDVANLKDTALSGSGGLVSNSTGLLLENPTISAPLTFSANALACATCATTTSGGALSAVAPLAITSGGAISLQNSTPANVTSALGTDTKVFTASGSAAANGDVIQGDSAGGIADSGTLLFSLAPKASPTFTGTVTLPTLAATTINGAAFSGTFTGGPTFSGNIAFTGTPTFSNALALGSSTATTQAAGNNSTDVATTAYANTVYNLIQASGSPYTMSALTGFYWNNTASAYSWDLPTPAAGLQICVGNYQARATAQSLIPGSGVTIYFEGVAGTAGSSTGLVSGGALGDFICLVGTSTTTYMAIGAGFGTWVNH
jgi:hypothetical protein